LHLRRTAACLFDIGAEVFPLCRHSFLASRVESSVLARARTLGAGRPRRVAILSDMPLRLHHVVIDAHDLPSLARFWAEALGWTVLSTLEREVVVGPDVDAPLGLCFMPAGGTRKTVKNRVHVDLTTTADDRDSEIERLIGLGASRVDVGQTDQDSWDVLADPEGNEFCVVRPKTSLVG